MKRQFDASNASVQIYTFKDGLLARVGHDLCLAVTRFEVTLAEGVDAWFDAASIDVVHALRAGEPHPEGLSTSDRETIRRNTANEVLHSRRFPRITFRSDAIDETAEGLETSGELTLHGKTREVGVAAVTDGGDLVITAEIHQPDFGITPFSALLGTLRVLPKVRVVVRLRNYK